MKRTPVALLLVVSTVCCARGGGDLPADTGIRGTVVAGPQCPVERADSPCPDQPVQATVVATSSTGAVAGKAESNARGRFLMVIPAGHYVLTVEDLHGIQSSKPVEAVVREGAFTEVTVLVDTGIR